jgi:GntR family transcriptional repressor for pyruvate dehydrogenase complex
VLRTVRRVRLHEEIVIQLAELIRQGQLQPGDRLPPERELADRFGVSRSSVREALRILELHGLVARRPGTGTVIASGTPQGLIRSLTQLALHDIIELRLIVEPAVAALAAERASPADISRLEDILREQEAQIQRGETGAAADAAFHLAIAQATHNRALVRLAEALAEILAVSRDPCVQTPQRSRLSLQSHRQILGAIKGGSPAAARQAMEDHIRRVDLALFGVTEPGLTPIPAENREGTSRD